MALTNPKNKLAQKKQMTPKQIEDAKRQYPLFPPINQVKPFIAQFTCSGCGTHMYRECIHWTNIQGPTYPDINTLAKDLVMTIDELRHIAHTEGHGFCFCGIFKPTLFWQIWDPPKDPKGYLAETFTMNQYSKENTNDKDKAEQYKGESAAEENVHRPDKGSVRKRVPKTER